MKIESVKPYKGKLFEVMLEDGSKLWLHADLIAEAGLRAGVQVDDDDLAALRQKAAEHRTYEYALYLLELRAYSYRELHDKLMRAKNAQEDAVELTLAKLVRLGLLNDAQYAQQLARQYVEGKKYGLRRAAYEMKHRGLSPHDIEDALAPYDDPELISETLLELLKKKYARYLADPDDRKSAEKVTAALVRRGFTYQQIKYAFEDYQAWLEEQET